MERSKYGKTVVKVGISLDLRVDRCFKDDKPTSVKSNNRVNKQERIKFNY